MPRSPTASLIDFGSGANQTLHIGGFGYVNAVINANTNSLAVQVDPNGQLFVANTTSALQASTFNIVAQRHAGSCHLPDQSQQPDAGGAGHSSANLSGANLGLQFGTYISSGFTAASTANPTTQTITLIRAPVIIDTTLAAQNAQLGLNTPFLFETPAESGVTPLAVINDAATGQQTMLLRLLPRSTGRRMPTAPPA